MDPRETAEILKAWAVEAGFDRAGLDLWPRVARYARGRDCHDVMQERLTVLEARIAAVAAIPVSVAVLSSPGPFSLSVIVLRRYL